MKEIWKDVVGFEGRYMVSNLGNAKSCRYYGHEGEHLLKLSTHHCGYLVVTLGKRPERKQHTVHSLVAKAFLPNPDNLPAINHIDGNKANNQVSNLEWISYRSNTAHAINTGLFKPHETPKRIGKNNVNSKPVLQFDPNGIFIKRWDSIADACRSFGRGHSNIYLCVEGRRKTAYGFKWEYE